MNETPRKRRRFGCLGALIAIAGALVLLYGVVVALYPWSTHIGNAFTPTLRWSGYGVGVSTSGQRYAVYIAFGPQFGRRGSCFNCRNNDFSGSGELCTPSASYVYTRLDGALGAHWSTDGASMHVNLYAGKDDARRFTPSLSGRWQGGVLTLGDDGQLDHFLDAAGRPREQQTGGADPNATTFQLRQGSRDAFHAACRTLAG